MSNHGKAILALAAVTAGLLLATAQKQDQAEVALRAAIDKELIDGDLKAAIEMYKKILARPGGNRTVAAKALLHIGQCQEKRGNAEARKAYEQLLRDYPDQGELAAQARTRLAALEKAGGLSYPPAITVRKVWEGREGETPGSPSADGRYFTFGHMATGDIAVRDLVTGEQRRLTHEGTWDDPMQWGWAGLISPDGKQVAYSWYAPKGIPELRVVGFDGGKSRTLLRGNQEMAEIYPQAWAPDGKQILAILQKKDLSNQIGFVSVADGSIRILKSLPPRTKASSVTRSIKASLSPDGRNIVYDFLSREDCKEHDIFLLPADGSPGAPLIQHLSDDKRPAWTPDGKKVLFASDRTGSWGFWAIAVADGKPQGPPELVKADIGAIRWLTGVTRQGACFYTTNAGMEDVHIAEIDPETGKLLGPPAPAAGRFVGSSMAPSWSPDGEHLAYLAQRGSNILYQPGGLATVIRSLRTGEERELSTNLNQMLGPVRWFPDGRSLLVGAWEGTYQDGDAAVYRVDVQTDAVSLVTRVGRDVGLPYLAQNGKAILYFQFRKDGPNGLAIMIHQIDTGQAKEIYRLVGASWAAVAMSPDGRQVAFVEPDKAKQSVAIKIMPVAGGEPRELLRVGPPESINEESRMEWMPDGRHLLIVRRSSRGWPMTELWRVPVQGGQPQKLGLAMERIRFPSVHPDGRRIAFDAGQGKPRRLELWVMENFLPELSAAR